MAAPAPLSPLAPKKYPALPPIEGVRFATAAAGVRYAGRTDVMLALFDAPAAVAGVFTRSKCPSAPVDWCRAQSRGAARRARWSSIPATPTLSPAASAPRRSTEVAEAVAQGDRRAARAKSSWPRPA